MDLEERILSFASALLAGGAELDGRKAIIVSAFLIEMMDSMARFEKDVEPRRRCDS